MSLLSYKLQPDFWFLAINILRVYDMAVALSELWIMTVIDLLFDSVFISRWQRRQFEF